MKADQLTVAFITLMSRAVLVRVNSAQSNDFLELRLVRLSLVIYNYHLYRYNCIHLLFNDDICELVMVLGASKFH